MDASRPNVFLDAAPADAGTRGRDSMFLMATLRSPATRQAMKVRVRNLSAGGLMAELPEPITPDSPIEVELRGIGSVAGRIAWQTEGRAGIAFDREIDPQRARTSAGNGAPEKATPFRLGR